MIQGLLALLVIAAAIVAAGFLADHPGRVEIVWQDWQIDTSVGVLAAATLALALLIWGLVTAATTLIGLPAGIRRRLRQRTAGALHRVGREISFVLAAGVAQHLQCCGCLALRCGLNLDVAHHVNRSACLRMGLRHGDDRQGQCKNQTKARIHVLSSPDRDRIVVLDFHHDVAHRFALLDGFVRRDDIVERKREGDVVHEFLLVH